MSLIDNLSAINTIKQNIKNAIEFKGQNVTNFASYPNAIENISSGGEGVYQYNSLENMYADISNCSNGDLAAVYASSQAGITETTEFQVATFPETVVLDEAIENYVEVSFQAVDESVMFDCWGNLDSSRFSMSCYTNDGDIRIEYESQDGITYTRTRFRKNQEDISGNEMDFGMLIKFGNRYGEIEFNTAISKFIISGSTVFDGVFKYNGTNFVSLSNTGLNANSETVWGSRFYGTNGIQDGTLNQTSNLNLQQLRNRVNLYSNLSYLNANNTVTNMAEWWHNKELLKAVPNINTSYVTDMNSTFFQCYNLLEVPNFDTSNVTNMEDMLYACNNLISVPEFNMVKVNRAGYMFYDCNSLSSESYENIAHSLNTASNLNVNWLYSLGLCDPFKFSDNAINSLNSLGYLDAIRYKEEDNVSTEYKVTYGSNTITINKTSNYDVYGMILNRGITNITNIPNGSNLIISDNTGNGSLIMLKDIFYWFKRTNVINYLDLSNLRTENVLNADNMFELCTSILHISNFNTSNITSMYQMFSHSSITNIPNFDTSNVRNMYQMFSHSSITNIPNFNTAKVTNMGNMFWCSNLTNTPNLNTSNVVYAGGMFEMCNNLTTANNLNFTNCISTAYMFNSCNRLSNVNNLSFTNIDNSVNLFNNTPNLLSANRLKFSNVNKLSYLFYNCRTLKTIDNLTMTDINEALYAISWCPNLTTLSNFNASNITNACALFLQCYNLTTIPNFDTSNTINMQKLVYNCSKISTIPNFNTDKVSDMSYMFYNCCNLYDVPNFNTSSVTNMSYMFYNCCNLKVIPQYDTSSVNNMGWMFSRCNNLRPAGIQNVINMCLNSNITNKAQMNLNNANDNSPFCGTKFDSSYYSNRLAELDAAGWTY